jgi:hypothetical protein
MREASRVRPRSSRRRSSAQRRGSSARARRRRSCEQSRNMLSAQAADPIIASVSTTRC